MNYDADEECTADYGPFGNNSCGCSACNPPPRKTSQADRLRDERASRKREADRKTSSNFNRYMIDMYNARRPR